MPDAFFRQAFSGRLVMIGCGSIGQGVLPLLLRHLDMLREQMLVIATTHAHTAAARENGIPCLLARLTPENFRAVLEPRLEPGDFLLNLSVDVSSIALIALCQERGALYLDTCIETWAGEHVDPALSPSMRTNDALREASLALRRRSRDAPTAVLTHGANPGLVSHLLKQALLDVAVSSGNRVVLPRTRDQWAALAAKLGVRTIHIAERDTQSSRRRKQPGEFVNTWSAQAFADEALQPAELGWGSHERHFPADGVRHRSASRAAIHLDRPGASTRVRTWTPMAGPFHGFLITHAESISIADYLTVGEGAHPAYRPTVHYAYHPCDDAVLSLLELTENNGTLQAEHRLLMDDIESGIDELGVLLMGHDRSTYWYGSQLSIEQARSLCPWNNATTLQVAAAVMAGVVWAMRNPSCGIVEPDDLPFDDVLALCRHYLGNVVGVFSDWTPLQGREVLFKEDVDRDDPWQFKNFRVT
ncbi:MAG: saccharopine dehydrogenase NADP-binding domain-containing protein [Pseudomonadota bacterium]|nr:saccharopine dehydrogenase NADP-binding domain-containing protein [Pseudomonadota bacterium]